MSFEKLDLEAERDGELMRGKRDEKQIIDVCFRYQNCLTCDVLVFSYIVPAVFVYGCDKQIRGRLRERFLVAQEKVAMK